MKDKKIEIKIITAKELQKILKEKKQCNKDYNRLTEEDTKKLTSALLESLKEYHAKRTPLLQELEKEILYSYLFPEKKEISKIEKIYQELKQILKEIEKEINILDPQFLKKSSCLN